jgi:hypothetical protein
LQQQQGCPPNLRMSGAHTGNLDRVRNDHDGQGQGICRPPFWEQPSCALPDWEETPAQEQASCRFGVRSATVTAWRLPSQGQQWLLLPGLALEAIPGLGWFHYGCLWLGRLLSWALLAQVSNGTDEQPFRAVVARWQTARRTACARGNRRSAKGRRRPPRRGTLGCERSCSKRRAFGWTRHCTQNDLGPYRTSRRVPNVSCSRALLRTRRYNVRGSLVPAE